MAIMVLFAFGCSGGDDSGNGKNSSKISPVIITEAVRGDADDPAIWINKNNPAESLILGTDKITNGALYVFDLAGHIIREKTVYGLERPNNVDVEYGLLISGTPVDIAVVTERGAHRLRVYRLPDMTPIDNGGIPVFTGEKYREPMGIALYKRPRDGAVFSIVSRKEGARNGRYLWQYLLEDDGHGGVTGTKVREFGLFSGKKEIEAVAVDDELGYVYYSDERAGIRKYHADPSAANADVELTIIDTSGYGGDNEGISLYKINDGTGYLIVFFFFRMLHRKKMIVLDRYFYDLFIRGLRDPSAKAAPVPWYNLGLLIAPRPKGLLILDVPYELSLVRKGEIALEDWETIFSNYLNCYFAKPAKCLAWCNTELPLDRCVDFFQSVKNIVKK